MPRPTEAQVAIFHLPLKDYPEHMLPKFAYPRPRPRKPQDIAAAASAEGGPPMVTPPVGRIICRVWPYRLLVNTGAVRTTAVSAQYQGPALVTQIIFEQDNVAGPLGNFAVLWSLDNAGGGENLADTSRPSGTPIFEPQKNRHANPVVDPDEIAEGFSMTNVPPSVHNPRDLRLRYLIDHEGPFFLKVTQRGASGGPGGNQGVITCLEGPTVDDLMRVPF
jgi:hypothetical protein